MTANTTDAFSSIMSYTAEPDTEVTENVNIEKMQTRLEEDFDAARDNLKDLTILAQEAAGKMAKLAHQLQEPRAYDTLSKMIASAVIASKALVELHKNKQEGKDPTDVVPTQQITNNTILMTTDQLQQHMESVYQDAAAKQLEHKNGKNDTAE
jgi:hypothetical protein